MRVLDREWGFPFAFDVLFFGNECSRDALLRNRNNVIGYLEICLLLLGSSASSFFILRGNARDG